MRAAAAGRHAACGKHAARCVARGQQSKRAGARGKTYEPRARGARVQRYDTSSSRMPRRSDTACTLRDEQLQMLNRKPCSSSSSNWVLVTTLIFFFGSAVFARVVIVVFSATLAGAEERRATKENMWCRLCKLPRLCSTSGLSKYMMGKGLRGATRPRTTRGGACVRLVRSRGCAGHRVPLRTRVEAAMGGARCSPSEENVTYGERRGWKERSSSGRYPPLLKQHVKDHV